MWSYARTGAGVPSLEGAGSGEQGAGIGGSREQATMGWERGIHQVGLVNAPRLTCRFDRVSPVRRGSSSPAIRTTPSRTSSDRSADAGTPCSACSPKPPCSIGPARGAPPASPRGAGAGSPRAARPDPPAACVGLPPDADRREAETDGLEALRSVARLLEASGRRSDALGRSGAAEFAVVAAGVNRTGARQLARRLRDSVGVELRAGYDAVGSRRAGGGALEARSL